MSIGGSTQAGPNQLLPENRDNPLGIAAVLLVDATALWFNRITFYVPEPERQWDNEELARVHERIGELAQYLEGLMPVIPIESSQRERVYLDDLLGRKVALCGAYGPYCVRELARWLTTRGIYTFTLRDATAWAGSRPKGYLTAQIFPRFAFSL